MRIARLARVAVLVTTIAVSGTIGVETAATSASVVQTTMQVTKTGTVTKFASTTSFTIRAGSKSYLVTTNDMTRVTIGSKTGKISQLKKGEEVTVKGTLEMSTIKASSVATGM
jgi:hypothetical protein